LRAALKKFPYLIYSQTTYHCKTVFAFCIGLFFLCFSASAIDVAPEFLAMVTGSTIVVPGYSVPLLYDWNNDGLSDLLVGEGSGAITPRMRIYLNCGTQDAPSFSNWFYVQANGSDLTVPGGGCMGLFPRVFDWDGDNRKDLLVGQADGRVRIFTNSWSDAVPLFSTGFLAQAGPITSKTDIAVGARATPLMVDWNADGVRDLIVGAMDGRIAVFTNTRPIGSPDFPDCTYVTVTGSVLYVTTGRSSPALCDINMDGRNDLVVGNTEGQILCYTNIASNLAPDFAPPFMITSTGNPIDLPGTPRSRPYIGNWNQDGFADLLVGAGDGAVHVYIGLPEPSFICCIILFNLIAFMRRYLVAV
jgi:hypothetical protein